MKRYLLVNRDNEKMFRYAIALVSLIFTPVGQLVVVSNYRSFEAFKIVFE